MEKMSELESKPLTDTWVIVSSRIRDRDGLDKFGLDQYGFDSDGLYNKNFTDPRLDQEYRT